MRMSKFSAVTTQRERAEERSKLAVGKTFEADTAAPVMARVRLLMIISGLTTLVAIAAVLTVVGFRIFRAGNAGLPSAESIITLPKGSRLVASSIVGDQLVVTLDVAGASEIRTFDLKTLKETGRVRFVTEP